MRKIIADFLVGLAFFSGMVGLFVFPWLWDRTGYLIFGALTLLLWGPIIVACLIVMGAGLRRG